jgi:UDP-N-acetylglucosamine acyltransferase
MISAQAIVAPGAKIAPDAQIGPFSIIGADVAVGARSVVAAHVVITGHTSIGEDNRIFQFSSIGEAPQDLKHKGAPTRLEIGDRNTIREYCTMSCGTINDRGVTSIGNDNLFMAYTHVAHDCVIGDHIVMSNLAMIGGHVQLDDWVILSGYAAVHQRVKIGAHAFIAHHAGCTKDVPPYVTAVGNPAVPHSINSEGLKRRGFTPEQIRNLKNAYRILYRSELPLAAAVKQLGELAPSQPELAPLLAFIENSERSLIR